MLFQCKLCIPKMGRSSCSATLKWGLGMEPVIKQSPRRTAMGQHRGTMAIERECGHEQNSKHCSQTPATRRGEEAITATDVRQRATFRFINFELRAVWCWWWRRRRKKKERRRRNMGCSLGYFAENSLRNWWKWFENTKRIRQEESKRHSTVHAGPLSVKGKTSGKSRTPQSGMAIEVCRGL